MRWATGRRAMLRIAAHPTRPTRIAAARVAAPIVLAAALIAPAGAAWATEPTPTAPAAPFPRAAAWRSRARGSRRPRCGPPAAASARRAAAPRTRPRDAAGARSAGQPRASRTAEAVRTCRARSARPHRHACHAATPFTAFACLFPPARPEAGRSRTAAGIRPGPGPRGAVRRRGRASAPAARPSATPTAGSAHPSGHTYEQRRPLPHRGYTGRAPSLVPDAEESGPRLPRPPPREWGSRSRRTPPTHPATAYAGCSRSGWG